MRSLHGFLGGAEVRRSIIVVVVVAACGARTPDVVMTASVDDKARGLVQKRCGGCHKPARDLPVFVGRDPLSPELAVRAADRVCAGEMPQDGALSLLERDDVATALCALARSPACRPCSAPIYVRSPNAAIRIVNDKTGADVSAVPFASWLKIHSPRYALSTKLDATYLLLFTLMSWEACTRDKTGDVDACMATLLHKENWQLPPPR